MSALPEMAAVIRAVAPSAFAVLGPAPASSIALTMAGLPFLQAISSGVMAPTRVVAFGLAPAEMSSVATSRSSLNAAQCSGVMPSP